MQEPDHNEYTEAKRPFRLPEAFNGARLLFQAKPEHITHQSENCALEGHPLCSAAPLTDIRLHWKLTNADGQTIRHNELVIRCLLTNEAARAEVAGFAAWYSMMREVATQNDLCFHPPSEIPLTLTQASGEITKTPPHFFNS